MARAVTLLVNMEWSKDELVLVKLIDVYKQKEILWNFRHPGYCKRGMREVTLLEVVSQFAGKGMLQDKTFSPVLLQ